MANNPKQQLQKTQRLLDEFNDSKERLKELIQERCDFPISIENLSGDGLSVMCDTRNSGMSVKEFIKKFPMDKKLIEFKDFNPSL